MSSTAFGYNSEWYSYEQQSLDPIPLTSANVVLSFVNHGEPVKPVPECCEKDGSLIFNILTQLPELSRLCEYIRYAGLDSFYNSTSDIGPADGLTLFAPVNTQFEVMYSLSALNPQLRHHEGEKKLAQIDVLRSHTLNYPFYPEQLANRIQRAQTMLESNYVLCDWSGSRLILNPTLDKGAGKSFEGASAVLKIIQAENGMIYVIDRPLISTTPKLW